MALIYEKKTKEEVGSYQATSMWDKDYEVVYTTILDTRTGLIVSTEKCHKKHYKYETLHKPI